MRIALDHVLISQNLQCSQFKIGNNIGSDHFPIFVKITTKPIAISPTIETVKAEPKYVYGSMYLSATALPPASIPRVTAAIKYLSG